MLWYPFWPKFKLTHPILSVVHLPKMAPAMKAMKKAVGATGLTASAAFTKVAETAELKPKAVKVVVTKNGKLGGVLNMKLKKKPANAARKGVNPSTKEPRVFKAKESS